MGLRLGVFRKKRENGNVANENTFLDGCSGCLIEGDNKLIVGIGLRDMVFVDTEDATLIAQKDIVATKCGLGADG